MMNGSLYQHEVTSDQLIDCPMLPEQFAGVWSESGSRQPEQRLALAILERAIADLRTHRFARRRKRQRLYMDAYDWVAADDPAWTYSFVNVCRACGIEPTSMRSALIYMPHHAAAA
jgi:hypothetical protein